MNYFGKVILCISMSLYAVVIKSNALKRTEFESSLSNKLKSFGVTAPEYVQSKGFDLVCLLIIFSSLSLLKDFNFSAFVGGLSVITLDYVLYYQSGTEIKDIFIFMFLLGLGLMLASTIKNN